MNFEVMPWLKQSWGIAAATGLMASLSGAFYYLFRRREWL